MDPATLYNEARLSVVLPSAGSHPPPLPSRLAPASPPTDVDAWLETLLGAEQRTTTYYDETVTFYLVIQLADSAAALSRSQAHAFFLDCLPQPHLTVNSSLSYYDAAPARPPPAHRPHSALNSSHYPLTPAPYPTISDPTPLTDLAARESVLISTRSFDAGNAGEASNADNGSQVWVGQLSQGNWVAAWKFTSNLPFIQTSFVEPKLAVTITASFQDDPRLDRILSLQGTGAHLNGTEAGPIDQQEEQDDEEYMDDSYDDVNLLSSLGTSHDFHLPFSRLPSSFLPPLSNSIAPASNVHTRRHSRNSSLSSDRTVSAHTLGTSSPLLRRSILQTFDLRKPLHVSIRTIDCTIPDEDDPTRHGGPEGPAQGGMVVLLELVGPRSSSENELFQVDTIDVRATSRGGFGAGSGGGGSNDIEVRRVAGGSDDDESIRLGANDQFNLVYKLSLAPASQLVSSEPVIGIGRTSGEPAASVPIGVATSPSQRFTARFGSTEEDGPEGYEEDEEDRRTERARERERKKREDMFRRNLEVVVKGRILVESKDNAALGGYTVDETDREEGVQTRTAPTQEIASRWNYTIDVSSFAYQPPPIKASFGRADVKVSGSRTLPRPTSIAVPQIPLLPPSAVRPISAWTTANGDRTEVESIAGSKRHTMASLASLSLKSPVLGRKAFAPLPSQPFRPTPQRHSSNRASPLPPIATPGATGAATTNVPRRFFSLPPQSQESVATPTSATPTNSSFFHNLRHTDTPPPMNPVSPSVARSSLPVTAPTTQGLEPNRRTSWMSGLGIGKSNGTDSTGRGVTSWDTVSAPGGGPSLESGLGLGLEGPGSNSPLPPLPPHSSLPPRPSEIDNPHYYQYSEPVQNGRILITVSLVPLRTVKSRRKLEQGAPLLSAASERVVVPNDLPPATLPGLSTTLSPPASHHASFNFPPSRSSSPTSPRSRSASEGPDPDGPRPPRTGPVSDAERTALLTSRMPRVGLLDVFLVQLFVVNETDQVKRFVVGVPPRPVRAAAAVTTTTMTDRAGKFKARGGRAALGVRPPGSTDHDYDDDYYDYDDADADDDVSKFATLVPLENDVRIGPLAPNSCASLGLRMLAIAPGAHVLAELKLVDLADGTETRLKRPVSCVVE